MLLQILVHSWLGGCLRKHLKFVLQWANKSPNFWHFLLDNGVYWATRPTAKQILNRQYFIPKNAGYVRSSRTRIWIAILSQPPRISVRFSQKMMCANRILKHSYTNVSVSHSYTIAQLWSPQCPPRLNGFTFTNCK